MIPMLGRRALVLRRRAGAVAWDSNGAPVAPASADTAITGSVQPIGKDDVKRLPEGYRRDEWRKVFTETELHPLDQSSANPAGDQLVIDGKVYTVNMVDDWSTGPLPHYEAFVVREKE